MNLRTRLVRLEKRIPEKPTTPAAALDDTDEVDYLAVCDAMDKVAKDQSDTDTFHVPIDMERAAPFAEGLDDASRRAFMRLTPYAKVIAELGHELDEEV